MQRWDVVVVGGGILGTTLGYWLGAQYDGKIAVLEREVKVAEHSSRRNTGVIHRPFYLNPKERKVSAYIAALSFPLWKKYAVVRQLPWIEIGTLKVALVEEQIKSLEKNLEYARINGMAPSETNLLYPNEVAKIEPEIVCSAALLVKTDAIVDFKVFTETIRKDAESLGVQFLMEHSVEHIVKDEENIELWINGKSKPILTRYMINCGGGKALDIAQSIGLAGDYADLHFRGEYWKVGDEASKFVSRNVYSVPGHSDFPFLDPHWVIRINGQREIGPNAVPVPGPFVYEGLLRHASHWASELFRPPTINKIRIWFNDEFLTLSTKEIWSSLSKTEMIRRVQRFIPRLSNKHLTERGTAGIRSLVIDNKGHMMKETFEVFDSTSCHILNFNSPGATGSPAYAAQLVNQLGGNGALDHLKVNPKRTEPWEWEAAL